MPRVLLVHQPTDGGVARHVADLAGQLGDCGWEAVTCGPRPPAASHLDPSPVPGVAHVELAMGRSVRLREDANALRALRIIVRDLRPDVVHAHSSKAGALARAAFALDRRVPVVYTPHGFSFAGHFERDVERQAYRLVERALVPVTERLVAVSHFEAHLAATIGARRRSCVVHNGVAVPAAGPRDPRVAAVRSAGPTLCAVTQLRPGKGVETLLDAFAELRRTHPLAQLVIVGDGILRGELGERATQLGLGEAVHWLGEHAEPVSALRAADAFILPSWAESFPYALLEAMAVGLPVVASGVGGVTEALRPDVDGLVVPPRDPGALSGALDSILGDRTRAAAFADSARRRIEREFTLAAMARGMTAVYDAVRPGV